jgi:hypothetical protein
MKNKIKRLMLNHPETLRNSFYGLKFDSNRCSFNVYQQAVLRVINLILMNLIVFIFSLILRVNKL